jgi:hypothetical protein
VEGLKRVRIWSSKRQRQCRRNPTPLSKEVRWDVFLRFITEEVVQRAGERVLTCAPRNARVKSTFIEIAADCRPFAPQ